ncbi:MAG: SUMF1/EgtB/PvdO family nonheme iron enzyme [Verrucomicrobiota bacterium]
MLRGGSWNNSADNARCAYRNRNNPDNRNRNIGFRVVASTSFRRSDGPRGRPCRNCRAGGTASFPAEAKNGGVWSRPRLELPPAGEITAAPRPGQRPGAGPGSWPGWALPERRPVSLSKREVRRSGRDAAMGRRAAPGGR